MNRKEWIEKRRQIPERSRKNREIAQRLLPFLDSAQCVGFYRPFGAEADVDSLLADQFLAVYPRVDGQNMEFYAGSSFARSAFGVLEPTGDEVVIPDVLVVPMLVFCDGWRIGYGKGYYDRYLSKHPECKRIGIAYDEQEGHFVPQPWDERLDVLITPTRVLFFERPRQNG